MHMRILIVYGTTEGHTRKIARFLEDHLQAQGHAVVVSDATGEPPAPEDFDMVLLAGSLHMQRHQSALMHYATANALALNRMPSALLSVSLSVIADDAATRHEAMECATSFAKGCGWTPRRIELVAGALKYLEYDFFKRFIMRMIAKKEGRETDMSKDYEYTDWAALREFCDSFVASVKPQAAPVR